MSAKGGNHQTEFCAFMIKNIIKMKKIIDVSHFIQIYDVNSENWQKRSCGIVSLAMVLDYYGISVNPDKLIELGLDNNGYIEGVGWEHQALCGLATYYGLKSHRSEDDTIDNLLSSLDRNEPVIISIFKEWDQSNGGHIVVLNGFYASDDELLGFYVNDPVGASYKHKDEFIPLDKFVVGWKKRAIYVKKG
jgi:ABC-type bacteriocin/lantibiotic exporter with double-glycine peptidase domain